MFILNLINTFRCSQWRCVWCCQSSPCVPVMQYTQVFTVTVCLMLSVQSMCTCNARLLLPGLHLCITYHKVCLMLLVQSMCTCNARLLLPGLDLCITYHSCCGYWHSWSAKNPPKDPGRSAKATCPEQCCHWWLCLSWNSYHEKACRVVLGVLKMVLHSSYGRVASSYHSGLVWLNQMWMNSLRSSSRGWHLLKGDKTHTLMANCHGNSQCNLTSVVQS